MSTLRKVLARARIPAVLLIDKVLGRKVPRVVVLVVNNACNLRCKYCFGQYHSRHASQDFTTEELKRIIDDLRRMGTLYLTIHGGETLLRHDIGEIVRHIKSRGMYVNLITNGFLLKSKFDEIEGVDSLCISLDGREENNDLVRGKGSFKAAMEAIELVKKRGVSLRVQATLTKYTAGDIEYMAELARTIGFHLEFSLLFASTPALKDLCLSDEETRKALRKILELKKSYPIFTSRQSLELALDWPYSYDRTTLAIEDVKPPLRPIPCCYGRHKFTIDADGRAFPCFPFKDKFEYINVKEVGVEKAFRYIVEHNRCVLCPFLTQNDWSFMTTFSPSFLASQVRLHLNEILDRYR